MISGRWMKSGGSRAGLRTVRASPRLGRGAGAARPPARARPVPSPRSARLLRRAALAGAAFAAAVHGAPALGAQAPPPPGSDPEPKKIIEAAAARYEGLEGFCADIVQLLKVPLLRQEATSRGRFCYRRPNLLAIRFSDPKGRLIVADGEFLWDYDPVANKDQVIRTKLGTGPKPFSFHDEYLADSGKKYTPSYGGEAAVGGRPAHLLSLAPKEDGDVKKVRLWLDKESNLIQRVEITEENGSVRRITFAKVEVNPKVSPDLFRHTPAEGVRIVDLAR